MVNIDRGCLLPMLLGLVRCPAGDQCITLTGDEYANVEVVSRRRALYGYMAHSFDLVENRFAVVLASSLNL